MTDKPPLDPKLLGVAENDAQRSDRRRTGDDPTARLFAIEAARLLHDLHFEEVLVFDVRGLWNVADYVILATGTSARQIRSVGGQIEDVASGMGLSRFGRDLDEGRTWVVLDFVDVVIHLFEPITRAHYDLEMLWGDAPRVDWDRRAAEDS